MNEHAIRSRQLVDWSAAIWAGIIAGAVFLLLNLFVAILESSAGGKSQPEFFSTHPPENRVGRIEATIREMFPQGVPEGRLKP